MSVRIDDKPFEKIKIGVDKLANTVSQTLGPNGRNILIDMGENRAPMSTRDGVTVAHYINLKDPLERFGASLVKQAARNTNNEAGDGTSTATVLAQSIFSEGLRYIAAGESPIKIKRSIDDAVEKAIGKLKEIAKPVQGSDVEHVATISANNDSFIGKIIAEAINKVGKDGTVLVEDSSNQKTFVTFQDGMIVERGWGETSVYFVNNKNKRVVEYDNPRFLIIDDKIHTHLQLKPVLDLLVKEKFPLIISVRDIEDSVLGFLVTNKLPNEVNGGLPIAVIKTPSFNNPEIIEDFSNRVGARLFNPDWNPISNFKPDDLGSAKRIIIRQHDTTIVEGCGDISQRLTSLLEQAKETEDTITKGRLQDRINRLTNSVATLHVSANSETELKDIKLRIEDAINATRHAVAEGIVHGGGTALLKIRPPAASIGERILRSALEAPFRNIIKNTGENPEKILAEIEARNFELGYNAHTRLVSNLLEDGVIDPVIVTRTAIQKASSVATMLLMTGGCVVNEEKEK